MSKMSKDLEIFQKYKSGTSMYSLSKEYSVDKKTIKKIITQGKYYINLNTGEIVFTSKSISVEEQQVHYIYYHVECINKNLFKVQQDKFIQKQNDITRLSIFFGKHKVTIKRWKSKKEKLVECDSDGNISKDIITSPMRFLALETTEFSKYASKQFYIDKNGYVKGMELWYVRLSKKWLYYLKDYAWLWIEWLEKKEETQFSDYCQDRLSNNQKHKQDGEKDYTFINTTAGKELGKWILVQLKKYDKQYIKRVLNDYSSFVEDVEDKYFDICIPNILYIKKSGYYCDYIPSPLKRKVKSYILHLDYAEDVDESEYEKYIRKIDMEDDNINICESEFDEYFKYISA